MTGDPGMSSRNFRKDITIELLQRGRSARQGLQRLSAAGSSEYRRCQNSMPTPTPSPSRKSSCENEGWDRDIAVNEAGGDADPMLGGIRSGRCATGSRSRPWRPRGPGGAEAARARRGERRRALDAGRRPLLDRLLVDERAHCGSWRRVGLDPAGAATACWRRGGVANGPGAAHGPGMPTCCLRLLAATPFHYDFHPRRPWLDRVRLAMAELPSQDGVRTLSTGVRLPAPDSATTSRTDGLPDDEAEGTSLGRCRSTVIPTLTGDVEEGDGSGRQRPQHPTSTPCDRVRGRARHAVPEYQVTTCSARPCSDWRGRSMMFIASARLGWGLG